VAVVAPARSGARPFGIARGRLAVRARARGVGIGGRGIVKLPPRLFLGRAGASVMPPRRPIRRGGGRGGVPGGPPPPPRPFFPAHGGGVALAVPLPAGRQARGWAVA